MNWWIDQGIKVRDTVTTPEYWLGIVTSLSLLFVRHRIKLPKIKVTGGGGASKKLEDGEIFGSQIIQVYSDPYFLGYPVKRDDLVVKTARIYDLSKRSYEGHLMRWEREPTDKPFETTIQVGQSTGLYIYGIYKQRVHHYSGETLRNIELSETLVEHGRSRKLEIHIVDNLGRRYRIPFRISAEDRRNHPHKVNVSIRFKTALADRLQLLKYGVQEIWAAFTRPSW